MTKDYYTTGETAELFGVDVETVRRWARAGKYGAFKRGRKWYFLKEKIV